MTDLSIIEQLPEIIRNGEKTFEDIIKRPYAENFTQEELVIPEGQVKKPINQFYQGDNILVMKRLLKSGLKGKIDLIYIDPPFMTKTNQEGRIVINDGQKDHVIEQVAYRDNWEGGLISYLNMLCPRIYLMKELLSEQGSLYIHLDYRTVHYVKVILDCIFGQENFLNEIIWAYKSGGVSKRYYSRKHDTILVYTKTKDYIFNPQKEKSYNRDFKPYRFKGVKEYQDELGWYTLVNLKDVWQIDMVGRTSRERVGYATQKPEKLLERIILTSSNENSIVADFFAGSGTTGVVAENLNRSWIMADNSKLSGVTITKRLMGKGSTFNIYKTTSKIKDGGKLKLKVESREKEEGIYDIFIELDSYDISIENMDIKKKYIPKVKDIIDKNSLALIELIALDLDYDGEKAKLSRHFVRNSSIDSKLSIRDIKLREGQKIYFKYVDVFGKENYNMYQINKGKVILCQEY